MQIPVSIAPCIASVDMLIVISWVPDIASAECLMIDDEDQVNDGDQANNEDDNYGTVLKAETTTQVKSPKAN